jgi:hypothetical protein
MQPAFREHRTVIGELQELDGDVVRVVDDSGRLAVLPFDQIFEARLEVDWNVIMKEGKARP